MWLEFEEDKQTGIEFVFAGMLRKHIGSQNFAKPETDHISAIINQATLFSI